MPLFEEWFWNNYDSEYPDYDMNMNWYPIPTELDKKASELEHKHWLQEQEYKQDFIKFAKEQEEEGKYFEREGRLWYLWRLFEDWKQEPDCHEGLEEFQKEYKLTLLFGELDKKSTVTNLRHGLTIEDLEYLEKEELDLYIFKNIDPGFSSYPYNESAGPLEKYFEELIMMEKNTRLVIRHAMSTNNKDIKYSENADGPIPF